MESDHGFKPVMRLAAAVGLLVAGGAFARADSSVSRPATTRRSWGELCRARFEAARAESAKLDPALSTGKVELQVREEVAPLAEEVIFGWSQGKPHLRVAVEPPAPAAQRTPSWRSTGPNTEERHTAEHSASLDASLSYSAEQTSAMRALWREAADDCMRMDAPLPSASTSWGRACVARFAQARAESAAVDARFAAGAIDLSRESGTEHVHFAALPRLGWRADAGPESDAVSRAHLELGFAWTPTRDAGGWIFVPNHPHHSYPPTHDTLHRHERTANLYRDWDGSPSYDAVTAIWKRAGADCLDLK